MGRLIIVFGPPGTGKTESDLRMIESWLGGGASMEEVAYVTFMKSAALDGARRCGVTAEGSRNLWFRTLHSICFKLLGLGRDRVVNSPWLKAFGRKMGMAMEADQSEQDVEEVAEALLRIKSALEKPRSRPTGSLYRGLYNLSRLLCRTPGELDRVREMPHPGAMGYVWPGFIPSAYAAFVGAYERQKTSDGKLDFVDMLEHVLRFPIALPPWKYAVVDEAQDMSALQFAVVEKLMFDRCDMVVLSGDDDQAIMNFQGASADDFLSYRERAQIIELSQTHRFGDKIVNFAAAIAGRIRHRHPKNVKGLPERENLIEDVYGLNPSEIRDGDLLLHRHVSGCRELSGVLVSEGVPFWNERGPNPLARTSEIRAFMAWRSLSEGQGITADDLQYLMEHVPSMKEGNRLVIHGVKMKVSSMEPNRKIAPVSLGEFFSEEFVSRLKSRDPRHLECPFSGYYERLMKDGYDLRVPPKTILTTIHGAKGRQAPRVWLWTETYPKLLISSSGDNEHRVAYVGATRTQGTLRLVHENLVGDWTARYPYPDRKKDSSGSELS